MSPLLSQAQGSLSSDELRVHLSVPSDNVVINNTHSYSSRYQRIHTFPDDRDHDREGEGEYQEPSALLRPRDHRDSTGNSSTRVYEHTVCLSIHIYVWSVVSVVAECFRPNNKSYLTLYCDKEHEKWDIEHVMMEKNMPHAK